MEEKQINRLMVAMGRCGVKKLVIKREGFELELEREDKAPMRDFGNDSFEENPLKSDFERHRATATVHHVDPSSHKSKVETKEDVLSVYVTSPMVGTVYHSPSPNDPSFVKPGDRVEKNTVVCIVEAMKVMNEVKSGVSGIIAEVLVENTSPVEFGTKIFRVVPS